MRWNPSVRLVFADVDETVAGLHEPASPQMLAALSAYLNEGGCLCLVTGGSLERVTSGVTDRLDARLRPRVLIGPASGAQLWGFDFRGALHKRPLVDQARLTDATRDGWQRVLGQLVDEFELRLHPARSPARFRTEIGHDVREVMFSDRGPQMSLEFVNSTDEDLRRAVTGRANQLLNAAELPVRAHPTGVFALNMTLEGVSKGGAVTALTGSPELLDRIHLSAKDLVPEAIEVWGDDFSSARGGIDLDMCLALPPAVRTIDFREEDPAELPPDRNIVLWDGQHRLQHGLLEFLERR